MLTELKRTPSGPKGPLILVVSMYGLKPVPFKSKSFVISLHQQLLIVGTLSFDCKWRDRLHGLG
jgi:hypothetical protein